MKSKIAIARQVVQNIEGKKIGKPTPQGPKPHRADPNTAHLTASDPTYADALKFAMKLIGLRRRSQREMQTRLEAKSFETKTREAVMQELKRWKYLDDAEFAAAYLRDRLRFNPRGRTLLRQELRRQGVDEVLIETALQENFSEMKELEVAEVIATKKLLGLRDKDAQKVYNKLIFHLKSKGFAARIAHQAIRRVQNRKK